MSSQQGQFGFAEMPEWQQAAMEDVLVAEVVFNLPLERPYTYAIPELLRDRMRPGQRVLLPPEKVGAIAESWAIALPSGRPNRTSAR